MDVSRISATRVQGAQGQHRQRTSISDRISNMESAIDDAVTSGTLTGDQATHMKKELADITKILSHNSHKQNGSNNQAGSSKQLSEGDRQKIQSDLQELGKQVAAALHSQSGTETAPAATKAPATAGRGAQVDDLFKAMDGNGDGKIAKDEFMSYVSKTVSKPADDGQSSKGRFDTYGQQGSLTISVSITQSQFSFTA